MVPLDDDKNDRNKNGFFFWVCSQLSRLKPIRVLGGAMEIGSAQSELKCGSSRGRWLSRGLVAAHEGGFS